jgi:phosphoglycolate phosphatase
VGDLPGLIVFDLDGTLVDSRQDLADAANALVVERGGRLLPTEAVAAMVGEGAAILVRRALAAAGLPQDDAALPRFLALYDERLLRTTRLYDGILEAVRELARESPIAVLTNKPLAPSQTIIAALGLSPFVPSVVGGDGPFGRKPDPAGLRHLMAAHGSSPARTVLVGDSRIDFETARAAGTKICLARYGFGYAQFPTALLSGDEALVDAPADLRHVVPALITDS